MIEDVGDHLTFEQDEFETNDDLGEAACKAFFGIDTTDEADLDDVDPGLIPVVGYRVSLRSADEERAQVVAR